MDARRRREKRRSRCLPREKDEKPRKRGDTRKKDEGRCRTLEVATSTTRSHVGRGFGSLEKIAGAPSSTFPTFLLP